MSFGLSIFSIPYMCYEKKNIIITFIEEGGTSANLGEPGSISCKN